MAQAASRSMSMPLGRLPLYGQVRERIVAAIEQGEWEAGEALPSEFELADRFRVSQGTVRKGLDSLVADGVLTRRQGVGTFVAETGDDWGSALLRMTGPVLGASVELLACARGHAGEEAADALGMRHGAALIQITRLVRVEGAPFAVIESAVSADRFDGLDARRIKQANCNLRAVWLREFGLRVTPSAPLFRASLAGRDAARLLSTEAVSPLLDVMTVAEALNGEPIEWSVMRVRTDIFAYRV